MRSTAKQFVIVASLGLTLAGAALAASNTFKIKAVPVISDPTASGIVSAKWVARQGLPDSPRSSKARPPKRFKPGHALFLGKNGLTATDASARVDIQGVEGITLTEIGWDLRTDGSCTANSPRFEVVTQDDVVHVIGCDSATLLVEPVTEGWERRRYDIAAAVPVINPTDTVKSISIVLDEGTDAGAGFIYIDNIDINGVLIQKPGAVKLK
jgi:hypothetical protein